MKDDEGSVSLFVVILSVALIALLGLVADVGAATDEKGRAIHTAYAAARAGAGVLDGGDFVVSGAIKADPPQVQRAAADYLHSVGIDGGYTVTIEDGVVHVRIQMQQPTHILDLFGVDDLTVTGDGYARAVYGVTGGKP